MCWTTLPPVPGCSPPSPAQRSVNSLFCKQQIKHPSTPTPPRFGYKNCHCEIRIWHAGRRGLGWGCSVLQRSTFHGLALDNRQEKIFAFGFYVLTRKQTSSERFDCISSTHCFIIVVAGCCLNSKMQSGGVGYKPKFSFSSWSLGTPFLLSHG